MTTNPSSALSPALAALRDEYPGIYYWEDPRWGDRPLGEAVLAARSAAGPRDEDGLLREALERALPDALSAMTEGGEATMAPEPSDEPGSEYVLGLAAELAAHPALRHEPVSGEASGWEIRRHAAGLLAALDKYEKDWQTTSTGYTAVRLSKQFLRAALRTTPPRVLRMHIEWTRSSAPPRQSDERA